MGIGTGGGGRWVGDEMLIIGKEDATIKANGWELQSWKVTL